jgi:tetratricopeptide (TPR) repeat protein
MSTAPWRLRLLGNFQLEHEGQAVVTFAHRRQDVLLAYLALTPTQAHARFAVAHLLWPDKSRRYALNRLTEVLTLLGKQLDAADVGIEVVSATYQTIQLSAGIGTDVQAFDDLMAQAVRELDPLRQADLLEQAVALHGTGLLPVLDDPWVDEERQRLQSVRNFAAQLLAERLASEQPVGVGDANVALGAQDLGRYLARGRLLEGGAGGDVPQPVLARGGVDVGFPEVDSGTDWPATPRDDRSQVERAVQLVETVEPYLTSPERSTWLDRLDAKRDGIYTALDWAIEREKAEPALRITGALWRYWFERGRIDEGRLYLDQALVLTQRPEGRWFAKAANGAGALSMQAGDLVIARRRFEQALAAWRELEDADGLGRVLDNLGIAAYKAGDFDAARRSYQEAIAVLRQTDNTPALAATLKNAAMVANAEGRSEDATVLLRERLQIGRLLGDKGIVASTLIGLATGTEDWAEAAALVAEARPIYESQGDMKGIALCLRFSGDREREGGRLDMARAYFEGSLTIARAIKDFRGTGDSLKYLAAVAEAAGDLTRAREIYGQAMLLLHDTADWEGEQEVRAALDQLDGRGS